MGAAGEALNPDARHQEDGRRGRAHVPRPLPDPDHRRRSSPTARCRSSIRARSRRKSNTCTSAARPSAASCRSAGARPTQSLEAPKLEVFERLLKTSGDREISTTMAFVQALNIILRDKQVGPRCVPIVADEARTFGMEGMFRQLGIYAPHGQKYKPVDRDQLMYYREDAAGQVLEEGITECGAFSSWMACATSYSTNDLQMLPFYIYYSMFGFQRIGDSAWQAADMRARGFLLGATAGRTTLNGEGLQHEDGHSMVQAGADPELPQLRPDLRLRSRGDPAVRHAAHAHRAARRVLLPHPDERELRPPGHARRRGRRHHQGHVPAHAMPARPKKGELRVQLMGSGTILREAIAAAELLDKDFGVKADIWSCPSFNELARDGVDAERWNRLHPEAEPRKPYVTQLLEGRQGPAIVATDYIRAYRRADPRVRADALHRAGHRRLRPLGYAREPAPALRGRPLPHRACGDRGAGGGREDERRRMWRGRSSCTRSMRRRRIRLGFEFGHQEKAATRPPFLCGSTRKIFVR